MAIFTRPTDPDPYVPFKRPNPNAPDPGWQPGMGTVGDYPPAGGSTGGSGGSGSGGSGSSGSGRPGGTGGGGSDAAQDVSTVIIPPDPPPPPVDFREMARLLYPWLANMPELLNAFVDAWVRYADAPNAAELALATMRQHPAYDRYFPGNLREDGSLRLDEQTYLSTVDGYARLWASYGINPEVVQGNYRLWIEGEVSVAEASQRLTQAWQTLTEGPDGDQLSRAGDWYAENYGIEMTREAVFLSAVDPTIGQDILQRRLTMSQIGGSALEHGFRRSLQRVEQLSSRLDLASAQRFFAQAGDELRRARTFSWRYNDRAGRPDIGTIEDAFVLDDAGQRRRLEGNLRRELSVWERDPAAQRDSAGRVVGLTVR